MTSHATFDQPTLLASRSLARHLWDFAGAPLRYVLLPDPWSKQLGFTSLEEERLRAVMPRIRGRLLDIGAGANALVRSYRGEGVGVDVFDFGGGAQIVEDTRRLPFPDASFDTVTFLACLNHIPYREDALREAYRLLRPGGSVVATMINRWLGRVGHAIWWYSEDKHRGMAPGEVGGLNVSEMKRLLAGAGFDRVRFSRFGYGMNGLYEAVRPAAVRQAAA
jgi:SAM-dependent methyltransferase